MRSCQLRAIITAAEWSNPQAIHRLKDSRDFDTGCTRVVVCRRLYVDQAHNVLQCLYRY